MLRWVAKTHRNKSLSLLHVHPLQKTKASGSFTEDAKHDTVRGVFHVDATDRFGFMRGWSFIPFPSFVTSSWPFSEHPLSNSGQKNRERERMREAEIMHLSIAAPQRILISGPQCNHSVKTSLLISCCGATNVRPTRTARWARGNYDRKSYWHWFGVLGPIGEQAIVA